MMAHTYAIAVPSTTETERLIMFAENYNIMNYRKNSM